MKDSESLEQVLDLRMRPLLNTVKNNLSHENDSVDQIKTLMSQDHSYYRNSSGAMNAADREKMAQWEYRIVDHFGLSRELVGIAFSVLDRFTAKCACDRRAYKLAAMTSLFMAIKLHNPRRFSIGTLATLSRGEFDTSHIAQMELIMLKTLDWRLCPPTVQSFIYIWGNHLFKGPYAIESKERACFLAEIAVFDTLLASKERALLAIAALADGIEGLDRYAPSEEIEVTILRKLKTDFGVHYSQEEVHGIRNRLWYIYSNTSQCLADYSSQSDAMVPCNRNKLEQKDSVAVCRNTIKMKYSQSPRSVRMRCEQD
mmetsp:Transcript_9003/g.21393  ORF Transcript_9003/g.21393 Transcript_9003/m.21393 type:complete len:314 (-) Transcript_9003:72-1013(-)